MEHQRGWAHEGQGARLRASSTSAAPHYAHAWHQNEPSGLGESSPPGQPFQATFGSGFGPLQIQATCYGGILGTCNAGGSGKFSRFRGRLGLSLHTPGSIQGFWGLLQVPGLLELFREVLLMLLTSLLQSQTRTANKISNLFKSLQKHVSPPRRLNDLPDHSGLRGSPHTPFQCVWLHVSSHYDGSWDFSMHLTRSTRVLERTI